MVGHNRGKTGNFDNLEKRANKNARNQLENEFPPYLFGPITIYTIYFMVL